MYRNLHSENGWTSIALILAHGVSQPLLKTTLRPQIQVVTQSGDESSAKTKFIKVSETCIFYIGTLGLIDWTSGSRRDKTWVLVLAGYTFSKVARHSFCLVGQPGAPLSHCEVVTWQMVCHKYNAICHKFEIGPQLQVSVPVICWTGKILQTFYMELSWIYSLCP